MYEHRLFDPRKKYKGSYVVGEQWIDDYEKQIEELED